MNAPAIVHLLKSQGLLSAKSSSLAENSIGRRLRRLRLQKNYSLSQVASAVDVSIGFLSAIERDQMTASVATLRRLARFYQIKILSLFNPSEANPGRVTPAERKILDAGPGVRMELLSWGNTMMEPTCSASLHPPGAANPTRTKERSFSSSSAARWNFPSRKAKSCG
jgi:transcriptional regulator with XRE-family HTH domain